MIALSTARACSLSTMRSTGVNQSVHETVHHSHSSAALSQASHVAELPHVELHSPGLDEAAAG